MSIVVSGLIYIYLYFIIEVIINKLKNRILKSINVKNIRSNL